HDQNQQGTRVLRGIGLIHVPGIVIVEVENTGDLDFEVRGCGADDGVAGDAEEDSVGGNVCFGDCDIGQSENTERDIKYSLIPRPALRPLRSSSAIRSERKVAPVRAWIQSTKPRVPSSKLQSIFI